MTQGTNGPSGPQDEIDALLRDTLRDDLPAEVEARLERRIQRFVASRAEAERRPAPRFPAFVTVPSQRVIAIAAGLLLACGFGLQASSGPDGLVESLSDVSETVTLARVVREATSETCAGLEDPALASPAALADRIYRRWVLRRSRSGPDGSVAYEFLDRNESRVYMLVSPGPSQPPREIRRRRSVETPPGEDARPPEVAACTWEVSPPGTPEIVLMMGR
jgi:hypothetical protein